MSTSLSIILFIMLICFTAVMFTRDPVTKVTTTINGFFIDFTKYFTTISVATEDDNVAINNSA